MIWIKQGKDTPLNQQPQGTVPQMGDTLYNWMQNMTIGIVTKAVQNFQVIETMVEQSFMGVWQVFNERQLMLKPEGQRAWSWFMIHTQTVLFLEVDDVFIYKNEQYRVMTLKKYEEYGYYEYHVITDWKQSGPEPVTP